MLHSNTNYAMKRLLNKYLIISVLSAFIFTSCTDYLDVPVEAAKTPEDIFGTYNSFQGYVDQLYLYVVDPMQMLTSDACFGGEAISSTSFATGYSGVRSNYTGLVGRGYHQYQPNVTQAGIWGQGWTGIRVANIGLQYFEILEKSTGVTQAEKDKIKGQLLFFRAFFHQEILSAWGSIPYIAAPLANDFEQPRFYEYKGNKNYQACVEHIAEDLTEAAAKLPASWPNDLSERGRVTKIAALGYKAKALLYGASPLMCEYSEKPAQPDVEMMKRAAQAAWECIATADTAKMLNGTKACELLTWAEYDQMFATTDGSSPWKKEVVWGKFRMNKGKGLYDGASIGRIHVPDNATFKTNGNGVVDAVTQNFVDLFEMADGTKYNASLYDNDNAKRWEYRDPRFRRSVYVDRDLAGFEPATKLEMWGSTLSGAKGKTRAADGLQTPYIIHKFWPKGVNKVDAAKDPFKRDNFRTMVPLMRLAEVYLMYAEAVNEGYGSATERVSGATLNALEAFNVVRARAYQGATLIPLATADGGQYGSFRAQVINERAVETCFEGHYWYDLRRWKLGSALNQTPVQAMAFDKDWTVGSFVREELTKRIFEVPKHNWLPFPSATTKMFESFPQNEGWD